MRGERISAGRCKMHIVAGDQIGEVIVAIRIRVVVGVPMTVVPVSMQGDGDAGNAGFSGILEAVVVGIVPDEVAERAVWIMPASMVLSVSPAVRLTASDLPVVTLALLSLAVVCPRAVEYCVVNEYPLGTENPTI